MRTSSTPAGATLPTTSFQAVDDTGRPNPTSHITGGDASAFSTNQASSLWTLWGWCASTFRLDCSSQVYDVDIENPAGHTAATQNIPSQADLIALSEDFVKEERREIDINQKSEFIAIQKNMLETKNFSDMPGAVTRLIKMHGFEQAEVDRGFERGGGVYSYRNMVGSMLSFAPLLLTQIRTQPEFKNDQGFQLKMAAGYFASVLLTSCAAAAINARVLLHCIPFQDAVFCGSPYVAPELESKNTPGYIEIKKEVDNALKLIGDLNEKFELLPGLHGKTYEEALEKVHRLMAEIHQNKGTRHYTVRAQLHRAYFEGIQRQSILQTAKVYGNLAAGWASFLKHDPVLGMRIQFFIGIAQIIGQRFVAPADQRQLQNNLFKVEISARPLSGEDHHGDDQIIRGMLRTPREVRANNILMLATSYVDTQAQLIADALGMDATDYKQYRRLSRLKNDIEVFEPLKALIDQKRKALGDDVRYGKFGKMFDERSQFSERTEFLELITEVHAATEPEFKLSSIEKLIELERKVAGNSLTEEERVELAEHKDNLRAVLVRMPVEVKNSFFGKRSLLMASTCAARRRSPRNVGFDSEILSAAFKTLSARHSDEEILAEIIVKIAEQPEVLPATMHIRDGRIVAQVDQRNSQGGETFGETPVGPLASPWFANMGTTLENELGVSQQEFNQLLNSISGSGTPFPAPGSEGCRELQKIQNKLDNAITNLKSDRVFENWGLAGLESELIRATRSKNYCRENDLFLEIEKIFHVSNALFDIEQYKNYHELRMRRGGNNVRALNPTETHSLRQLKQVIDSSLQKISSKRSPADAMASLANLEKKYSEIEDDPRYIIERRFERVSDHHKKLVIDGMQVTRNEGFFHIKTEAGMLLKEGLRRGGNAPEYMSNYAAGMWRAFQLGVTGVNGPLILTAAVGLCEHIYKSTLENPHAFKSPAWPKALTTSITFIALAANILAAHRVAEANVSPLSWPLKFQKLLGGTGSIAETILQVGKLVIREMFRKAERSPGEPMYGEIGVRRIASRYYLATIQAGARFKDGIAILIHGGMQAKAARKSYEARMAADETFKQIEKEVKNLPPSNQVMLPPNPT